MTNLSWHNRPEYNAPAEGGLKGLKGASRARRLRWLLGLIGCHQKMLKVEVAERLMELRGLTPCMWRR